MISFRNLAAVAFMLVAASTQVEAQGGGGGGGGRGAGGSPEQQAAQRAMMFEGITLDAVQTKAVDSITAATAAKRQTMMQGAAAGGDRQAMMEQMRSMQTDEQKAIRALLTADQQPLFDKNVEKIAASRRRPGGSQ